MTRVVLCCGAGGVGKTTLSSALALRLALDGHRVVVLTIDPARRLADAIGIPLVGNTATPVDLSALGARGTLHALMLDVRSTADALVGRLLGDRATFERIRGNVYYQYFSSRLAGTHEFMALERLYGLVEEGGYDVVVVDTPPSLHAIDFLTASDRLIGVLDQRVLRTLTLPRTKAGLRVLHHGGEAVTRILERMIGGTTITEIAEFIGSLEGITGSLSQRAEACRTLLRSQDTAFLVVTTAAPSALDESRDFLGALARNGFPFRGLLVNRVLPPPLDPLATPVLEAAPAEARELLEQAVRLFSDLARDDAGRLTAFLASLPEETPTWSVPVLGEEAQELDALVQMTAALPTLEALFPVRPSCR